MTKNIFAILITIFAAFALTLTSGCEDDAQGGALLGSAIGAGIGALADGDSQSIMTGAAIGGAVGYGVGNESDKKRMRQDIESVRAQQSTETIWITNSNGSQIPVKLTKSGPGYVGPRGEYYPTRPTEDQLRQAYGF